MPHNPKEPIAIVGVGCRFPGSSDTPSKLWDLLKEPRDISQEIPPDRFNIDGYYHRLGNHHGTTNCRRSYFLDEDITHFDNQFFGIPTGEAEAIDPQQRLLLEVTYEAVDSAGLTLDGLHGSYTAVYVGIMCDDYRQQQSQDLDALSTYNATGTAGSNASSRLSYFFDWHGPSMTLDTACSSSLVAVNEAVQALRNGTSRMAVAAGTNLLLFPIAYVTESNLNMLSPTGRCHMWDSRADGYSRGEGVAAIVLKTLSTAIADGDHIECIIREIGLNHDGRTPGLTMPSAAAQAALIRKVYQNAGLNPTDKYDRCQYFEAHGTGTPAGDPQEAEALSLAFFDGKSHDKDEILHVGSVKTVIGHTEGTAGLAGLIKAYMALKHGVIPPNLHFSRLNPRLAPFVRHLKIPTAPQPWPKVADGAPRRASVNSFGFGGANAHVIIETYQPAILAISYPILDASPGSTSSQCSTKSLLSSPSSESLSSMTTTEFETRPVIPFIFSAASEKSLLAMLQLFAAHLKQNKDINPIDLAYTLSAKKSALSTRASFSAPSTSQLLSKIEKALSMAETEDKPVSIQWTGTPSILGIFTGQGAQWATMGTELISSIPKARNILDELDQSLALLPESRRPRWSLIRELQADTTSRIGDAEISQTLCTAVQIVLVDLLRIAGVRFSAVVGHSSGEIAAAYASGYIRKVDAIRIAYYRGYLATLATNKSGERGAMMAVGTSFEDAKELCDLEDFEGQLCVAAHNSPTSVTLSGDQDAITRAKTIFDEEKRFARPLKVDTAYHSHHMIPCAEPYLQALHDCKIRILRPTEDAPKWFSSVHDGNLVNESAALNGQYWVDNMCRPVLFYKALEACLKQDGLAINFAIEIGPHSALKGPAIDTIQHVSSESMRYSGTLNRGKDDLEAFKDVLGSIWANLGPKAIDLELMAKFGYEDHVKFQTITGLPSYPWQHDKSLWTEARMCKAQRLQSAPFHDLLGKTTADGSAGEWQWKNILKVNELPWLTGHALQGQTVFPATGYIAIAMEAAMQIAGTRPVRLIELYDLQIPKAISINDTMGTEVQTCVVIKPSTASDTSILLADFSASSAVVSKELTKMALNCSGQLSITFEDATEPSKHILPPREITPVNMSPVLLDQFYSSLREDIGYMYDDDFRGITSLTRKNGLSTGTIRKPALEEGATELVFHPALGDCALQGMYATIGTPGDGMLWSILVPSGCRRVALAPSLCGSNMTDEVAFDCKLITAGDGLMPGDVDVFTAGYKKKIIQFEGLSFAPFAAATSKDDRCLFQRSAWYNEAPSGELVIGDRGPTPQEKQKALDAERAAFFYLKNLHLHVDKEKRSTLPWYRRAMLEYSELMYETVRTGRHGYANEWFNDTHEVIVEMMESYGDDADFNLTRAVGENITRAEILSGEQNILEFMTENDYLTQYYEKAAGFQFSNESVARLIAQLTNKFPHMNFCEIGAGTGGATKPILERIDNKFASYTYTDISSAFFEEGSQKVQAWQHKIIFKTLNIEEDPETQGFVPHTYDCVIAANVLHATKSLETTMRNVRSMLKPGGYLVLYEGLGNEVMRFGAVMGGLPGWWVGRDEGRRYAPTITLDEWDALFRKTGFTGVEASTPMIDKVSVAHTIFCTMASNDDIEALRNPLVVQPSRAIEKPLVVLGGKTEVVASAIGKLTSALRPYFDSLIIIESLDSVPDIPPNAHILGLAECDGAVFDKISEAHWTNLQKLLTDSKSILWVTIGAHATQPYGAMSVGIFRNLYYEMLGTDVHLLDFENNASIDADTISKLELQIQKMDHLKVEGRADSVLWTVEPEVRVKGGTLQMHRIQPDDQRNARLNTVRRPITELVSVASQTGIRLLSHGNSYILKEEYTSVQDLSADNVVVHVSTSSISSIKTSVGFVFVCLGKFAGTGQTVLCLSGSNASRITVHRSWAIPIDVDVVVDRQYLSFVVGALFNHQIMKYVPDTGDLLVHEPDTGHASLLANQMALQGRSAFFTSAHHDLEYRKGNWRYVHGGSTNAAIAEGLPANISFYLDATPGSGDGSSLGERIGAALPKTCEKLKLASLLGQETSQLPIQAPESIMELLRRVKAFASSQFSGVPDGAPLETIPVKVLLSSTSRTFGPVSLVEWRGDSAVPLSYEPITSRPDLFRPDRTYWLAGLSGDLGRSLADFMAAHGARHIVISSRNPPIEEEWVQWHKSRGTQLALLKCDMTSSSSIKSVYDHICATMPTIAGVANGAMVLSDKLYTQMPLSSFLLVTRPKIEGTIYLDAIFSESNPNKLNWFIAFSSIVATRGNPGQANYAAANCFMKVLVTQRRARGLAGSSIDISRVQGVGYVERELRTDRLTKEQKDRLVAGSMSMPMSETDTHALFAEAIISGRPNSGLDHEIITGLAPVDREKMNLNMWPRNPMFGLLLKDKEERVLEISGREAQVPVRKLLEDAKSDKDVLKILKDSISAKLRKTLFMPASDSLPEATPLVDFGVDSLVGVEIRAWFLDQLAVDVPVMRILGGVSVGDLADFAVENMPAVQSGT